ncbi:sialate O-acetylesterase [Paenibacillus sp. PAMC21692]|uniref:sialate O-acetylesterase n=1 Tax=Paenibacillus sp. PAMC21692 TaxID=2762320 RepID=UPI00164E7BE4|nr:sialate O-acetylesterase [Paenibacillus sp. PAMC21692]QNK54965.1 hypothetical protein H7F31_20255 [Paenibacillus sp. PAMC21692]
MLDERMNVPVVFLTHPKPYQVIQRKGYCAAQAYANHLGGPSLGEGTLIIAGSVSGRKHGRLEARTLLLHDAYGIAVDWKDLDAEWEGEQFEAAFLVPAGGWYRLELRYIDMERGKQSESVVVEPVGVGEVFIIAGQSYAENCNDSCMRIEDPQGRISALDPRTQEWRVAHDPQPTVNRSDDNEQSRKGTIWPAAMNHLLPLLRVPIGMVNVAVGATSSRQWMPGEPLFENLQHAGKAVGPFRALLWQQGESDVIEGTSTEVYKSRLLAIKAELEEIWGHSFLWLPAKSTLHPTVYIKPLEEGSIRLAIDELWSEPGFLPGPDTDILAGIGLHRAVERDSGHFTLLGQQQAGLLWCIAIWNLLQLSGVVNEQYEDVVRFEH